MAKQGTDWGLILFSVVALGAVAIIGTQMASKFGEGFGKGMGEAVTDAGKEARDSTIKVVIDLLNGGKEQAQPIIDTGTKIATDSAKAAWDSSLPGQTLNAWAELQKMLGLAGSSTAKANVYQSQMKQQASQAMTGAGVWSATPSQYSKLLTPAGKQKAAMQNQLDTAVAAARAQAAAAKNQVTTENASKTTSQGGTGIYNQSIGKVISIDQMMPEDRITMDTKNDMGKYGAMSVKPAASGPTVNAGASQIVSWTKITPTGVQVSDKPAEGFTGVTLEQLRKQLGY